MRDLLKWARDSFLGWVWGHVYQIFIPILVVSFVGVVIQALQLAGWVAPEPNDTEFVKEQQMLVYNAIDAYGKVSDWTSFFSLIMIAARLFRDGLAKLVKMLGL